MTTVAGACTSKGDEIENDAGSQGFIAHTLFDLRYIAVPLEVHRGGCIRSVQAPPTVVNVYDRSRRPTVKMTEEGVLFRIQPTSIVWQDKRKKK